MLEELEESNRWLTGHEIAASLLGRREMSISELNRVRPGLRESVLRALRSLERKGLVASQGSYPTRRWALAERAAKDARRQRANDQRYRRKERESERRFQAFMDELRAQTRARADDADRLIARLAKVLGHLRNANDHESHRRRPAPIAGGQVADTDMYRDPRQSAQGTAGALEASSGVYDVGLVARPCGPALLQPEARLVPRDQRAQLVRVTPHEVLSEPRSGYVHPLRDRPAALQQLHLRDVTDLPRRRRLLRETLPLPTEPSR